MFKKRLYSPEEKYQVISKVLDGCCIMKKYSLFNGTIEI